MKRGQALAALQDEVLQQDTITAEDVLSLRRALYADGEITRQEADLLFQLNHCSRGKDPSWDDLYVEALTDYFLWQQGTDSALGDKAARALIDRIGTDRLIEDATELKLLLNIIFRTSRTSDELKLFVLNAAKHSILHSSRPLYGDAPRAPGVIDQADVEIIRKVIYGRGGADGIAIGRSEAEVLFELNNLTVTQENHPSWQTLFVKAITMHLLFGGDSPEQVDEEEARWLIDHIDQDRIYHETETALLSYLAQEAEFLHPVLEPLCRKLGV